METKTPPTICHGEKRLPVNAGNQHDRHVPSTWFCPFHMVSISHLNFIQNTMDVAVGEVTPPLIPFRQEISEAKAT